MLFLVINLLIFIFSVVVLLVNLHINKLLIQHLTHFSSTRLIFDKVIFKLNQHNLLNDETDSNNPAISEEMAHERA